MAMSTTTLFAGTAAFFYYIKCILGFRQADVGTKEIAILTPRAGKAAVPISLAMKPFRRHNDAGITMEMDLFEGSSERRVFKKPG